MTMSGRRPNDRLGRIGKGLLEGLAAVGTMMADGPKLERIEQIDSEIERLQHEKDTLIASLIEPGDLKVSDDYDPNKAVIIHPARAGEGRLVKCEGSWRDNDPFDKSHPGCPYRKTQHIKHEFTLRD